MNLTHEDVHPKIYFPPYKASRCFLIWWWLSMYGESQCCAAIGYANRSDFVIGSNLIWPTEMAYVIHNELAVLGP